MAITGNKFEAYESIRNRISLYVKKGQELSDEMIIEIAKKEYDVNLTKKDIEEMRKNFERYLLKYK